MELVQSQVIFDKAAHTYTLNGKALKGITSTLVRRAYPHTYDKPDHLTEEKWQTVLSRAAERGTAVHETLEAYEKTGAMSDIPELTNWRAFKETHGLTVAASEYLVSDNEYYATAIDHVLEDTMGCAVIVDIKTTNTLNVPEVTLQLNIVVRLVSSSVSVILPTRCWMPFSKRTCRIDHSTAWCCLATFPCTSVEWRMRWQSCNVR